MDILKLYFIDVLKYKFFDFGGRASRAEFWYFHLFYFLLIFLYSLFDTSYIGSIGLLGGLQTVLSKIFGVALFVLLIPRFALVVRRLHDVDKSGWYYLVKLIPLIGGLILFVWFISEGYHGNNKWGPNPYEIAEDESYSHLLVDD